MSIGLFATPMDGKDLQRARGIMGRNSPLSMVRLNTKVPPYRFVYTAGQARIAIDIFCGSGTRLLGFLKLEIIELNRN